MISERMLLLRYAAGCESRYIIFILRKTIVLLRHKKDGIEIAIKYNLFTFSNCLPAFAPLPVLLEALSINE
jgi:hypothetical protein